MACPENAPIYDFSKQQCVTCQTYNADTRTCTGCQSNEYFNEQTKKCELLVTNPKATNYLGQITTPADQTVGVCPT